jgi:hypothetical protein
VAFDSMESGRAASVGDIPVVVGDVSDRASPLPHKSRGDGLVLRLRPVEGPVPISAKMGSVSEFLVVYLDSIDERLLDYLDEEDELRPEVVRRLRYYASALLEGSITPAAVAEDWADWFDLTRAFVAACAPEEIEELEEAAPLMTDEVGEGTVLTAADCAYLAAVEPLLDAYPEMRLGSSPTRRGTPCPRRR